MPKIISPMCPASFAVYCDRGGAILRCKCQEGYAGHLCERSVITWQHTFNQCCRLLTEGRVLWCTRICVSIQPLLPCILFSQIEQLNRWSQTYNKFSSKFVICHTATWSDSAHTTTVSINIHWFYSLRLDNECKNGDLHRNSPKTCCHKIIICL